MKLKVFDPQRAPPANPPEVRLHFWRTVLQLRDTFEAARDIHAQQRVILESVRLQRLLSERSRKRSRLERMRAPSPDDPFSRAEPTIRIAQ